MENQIAIAVGKCDLERRFMYMPAAPAGEFLWVVVPGESKEASPCADFAAEGGVSSVGKSTAPVQGLQLIRFVDPEGVRCFTCINAKDAALLVKANGTVGLSGKKC